MTVAACQQAPPQGLGVGIEEFNSQQFFECHETLEALWLAEPGLVRQLYQGILQIGVAFYHLQAQRYRPVVTLLERGMAYLEPFTPRCMNIDIAALLADTHCCLLALRALGPEGVERFDWGLVPKIEVEPEGLGVADG
jgi:uncharacterized protein